MHYTGLETKYCVLHIAMKNILFLNGHQYNYSSNFKMQIVEFSFSQMFLEPLYRQ